MNFLNLQYFLIAAEELNFTRAAKRLYISQQSLSNHISKLEDEFQALLFDRTPPLTLTNEGICLVRRAKEILCIKEDTTKELHDIKDFKRGELLIGSPRAWGRVILPYVLPLYSRMFPNVKLRVLEGITDDIELALHKGEVDLSIGFLPTDRSDIESECLCTEKILLLVPEQILQEYCPENFQEVRQKLSETSDLHLLQTCPFLVMNPSSRTGAFTHNIFKSLGITPHIVLESRTVETLLALCFQNMGAFLCPEVFVAEALQEKNIAFMQSLNIFSLPYEGSEREIAVNHLKNKYLSQAAKEFIKLTQQCMKEGPFNLNVFY